MTTMHAMTVHVEPEPATERGPFERCCFCRKPTRYWTLLSDREPAHQVACCRRCAQRAEPKDVPTKTAWCRREEIASRERR